MCAALKKDAALEAQETPTKSSFEEIQNMAS